MKYIYIAGPYSVGDTAVNVRNAILAADLVAAKGYVPYVPHVLHFWHLVLPHDYEFWTTLDFAWLKRCDAVLRLPGVSLGADTEVALASLWGMPIYFNVEELP